LITKLTDEIQPESVQKQFAIWVLKICHSLNSSQSQRTEGSSAIINESDCTLNLLFYTRSTLC